MSERKQQILQAAVDIIVDEGYSSLSMRALARASGIKLGALQYHFRTSEEMLRALVAYISDIYHINFDAMKANEPLTIKGVLEFVSSEPADGRLQADKLWPQLWAMGQVEPLVADLVEDIYAEYLQILEGLLQKAGSKNPRVESISLMAFIEGSTIFVAPGKRWENDDSKIRSVVCDLVDKLYGGDA
jgi:AcrR family transcriptional regulator